jgi:hypothetical protein
MEVEVLDQLPSKNKMKLPLAIKSQVGSSKSDRKKKRKKKKKVVFFMLFYAPICEPQFVSLNIWPEHEKLDNEIKFFKYLCLFALISSHPIAGLLL